MSAPLYLQSKDVSAVRSASADVELAEVSDLLKKAAGAYRSLYSSASAVGMEVPYEANLNNIGGLVWVEQIMVSGGVQGLHLMKAGEGWK